ncbi:MAG: hypothetical protein JXA08_04260 [Methanomicrobiaceae archaeon]|nr:hypothetical protein [Methanomicrobiaceae archaeon]
MVPPLFFDLLQGPAVVLGMAGAVLVTAKARGIRRAGFGCWIVGNLIWLAFSYADENRYLMLMFSFYLITAIIGLKNSMLTPDSPNI